MKTVIVTGANSGLGFETAKKIAGKEGYRVILACRSIEKAEEAKKVIIEATGNTSITTLELNLSSLQSVRNFATKIKEEGITVDGLDCNAGITGLDGGVSQDGKEIVFATNHLGHFLLTNLLLPYMNENARIVNVSSEVHNPPGETLVWPGVDALAKGETSGRERYRLSKLCNLYFTYELDRRLKEKGSKITVNGFNPGLLLETNFGGRKRPKEEIEKRKKEMEYWLGDLDTSAQAVADFLTESEFAGVSAKYFDRSTKMIPSSELSYSAGNALELWRESAKMCGLAESICLSEE